MKMKKIACLLLGGLLIMGSMAGCGNTSKADGNGSREEAGSGQDPKAGDQDRSAGKEETSASNHKLAEISVVSREDGSGTRGAFIELFGVQEKDGDGNKVDYTTEEAIISNSTETMMATVSGDVNAIGYTSLGSMNDTVKAVSIDGVVPGVETIKDGSYTISRPFHIVTNGKESDAAKDFIQFILSEKGQEIVEENGYIAVDHSGSVKSNGSKGKVVVAGSSSVAPVMEKLSEAFQEVNQDVEIEIQESDSTTGMTAVKDGNCDIGMASRDLEKSEENAGLIPKVIAMDGIAVIVNKDNPRNDLSKDAVKRIFTGKFMEWSEVQ